MSPPAAPPRTIRGWWFVCHRRASVTACLAVRPIHRAGISSCLPDVRVAAVHVLIRMRDRNADEAVPNAASSAAGVGSGRRRQWIGTRGYARARQRSHFSLFQVRQERSRRVLQPRQPHLHESLVAGPPKQLFLRPSARRDAVRNGYGGVHFDMSRLHRRVRAHRGDARPREFQSRTDDVDYALIDGLHPIDVQVQRRSKSACAEQSCARHHRNAQSCRSH